MVSSSISTFLFKILSSVVKKYWHPAEIHLVQIAVLGLDRATDKQMIFPFDCLEVRVNLRSVNQVK